MIINVRCYSCGKVLANKWNSYEKMLSEGVEPKAALDTLGLKRICCRTNMMSHVNLIDKLLKYSNTEEDEKACDIDI